MKPSNLAACAVMSFLAAASCAPQRPQEADLVILYTTDVHGACLPFDFKKNAPMLTSLANVSTYVGQVREEHPDAVMLFDTGDYLQGQPSLYYYSYIDTASEHIVSRVYNKLCYDAIGLGNHDIEAGDALYERRLPHELQMPLLCANAIDTRTGRPMFKPYIMVERQGIRVAVLGMITPNIHAWLSKSLWPNLEFQDMVECAAQWLPIIQQDKPDLIVGLFHAGSDPTSGGMDMDTYKNENGSVPVAVKVPGFDLILVGHDHSLTQLAVADASGDSVRVLDAGTQAAFVGRADIHLTLGADGTYRKEIRTELVPMKEVAVDTTFYTDFRGVIDTVNHYVDTPIGTLTAPLAGIDGLYGPSEFMDFIHEAQLWATGADISMVSVLSPYDYIPAGALTWRQLFSLYKYENRLFTLDMTGEEVLKYLEYGFANQFGTMTSASDHLIHFRRDETGEIERNNYGPRLVTPTFNYTSASGIRYTVDVSKPAGQRVAVHAMSDGQPFDMQKHYKVAINSYQASGGGGFFPVGLGWDYDYLKSRTLHESEQDVRRYIAEYIAQIQIVTPRLRGDWEIVPQAWWKAGKERDIKFMDSRQR